MPENPPTDNPTGESLKVLIVDDSPPLVNFLRDVMVREGLVVLTAVDGANGLLLFRHQKPDLTLLGIHVRRGLGWEALESMRQYNSHASVIVLGSAKSDEAEKRAVKLGAYAFISKELGLEAFLHEVKRIALAALNMTGKSEKAKGRILVIDDEGQIRKMLQLFLESKGYEVVTAANGQEGLALVKKTRPHLILLDIDMPVMGGLEVLKHLREIDNEVAVMMISANDDETLAQQTIQAGATDYITKPLNIQYLETTVMAKLILMTS